MQFPETPSKGFLLVFPMLGFTLLIRSLGTTFSHVGGILFFSFLGEINKLVQHLAELLSNDIKAIPFMLRVTTDVTNLGRAT